MSKTLIRLWPVIHVAGIIGVTAALILLVISVLWQFGFADLTGIFPTLSPVYAILGSAALGFGIWYKCHKFRRLVREVKMRQDD